MVGEKVEQEVEAIPHEPPHKVDIPSIPQVPKPGDGESE